VIIYTLAANFMATSRIKFITDFFERHDPEENRYGDGLFKIKLHALFNCLSEKELKFLFLNQLSEQNGFGMAILNFIVKKVAAKQLDFTSIVGDLIEKYPLQTYKVQLHYRTILSVVIKYLDRKQIIEYFNLFINSERVNDRKKAYEIAGIIWTDVEEAVWKFFIKRRDSNALEQIIKYSTADDLISNLSIIWQGGDIKNFHKKLILEKTVESDISYFEFLKQTEPTFYVQTLRLRNLPIENRFLKFLVKRMLNENNGFVFYYIGLAKDWNLLVQTFKSKKTLKLN
jgi:hypothetical protein